MAEPMFRVGDMTKSEGEQMFRAFLGFDLKHLIEYMDNVRGAWNGEDSKFVFEGEVFHEDQVGAAEDIIQKAKELQDLLNEF